MFLVISLYALFAGLFGLSKTALAYSDPFFLIGSRFAAAGIILLMHQWIWNRQAFQQIRVSHFKPLLLLGVLSVYLTNIAEIWGLQYLSSAKTCLIYSLSPFLAALVAYFSLKEVLSGKKWVGLIIGFVGLIPIFGTPAELLAQNKTLSFLLTLPAGIQLDIPFLPELAVLMGVLCSVYGWILLKKLISQYNYTPLMANGISMLIGGSLALLHSYFSGETWNPIPVSDLGPFIQYTAAMCLISNIVCYNLYGYLLKRYTATFMSFAGLVTPLFASLFGWLFLSEAITWHFYVSMFIFAVGLSIFYHEELKREKIQVEPEPGVTPAID